MHGRRTGAMIPVLATVVVFAVLPWTVPGAGDADSDADDNLLSMEVNALTTLQEFQFNRAQLETLKKVAAETAGKPGRRKPAKVSANYHKLLVAVRDALAKASDAESIDKLLGELNQLHEKESPELDDGVDVTETAIKQAPVVFQMLSARQLAGFLASQAGNIVDPAEDLIEAIDKARTLDDKEWRTFRDELAERVGFAVAGNDEEKAAKISDQVIQWLIVVRNLDDKEFQASRADLEKRGRAIVGDRTALKIIQAFVESVLAELLSNPRLPNALERRLASPPKK